MGCYLVTDAAGFIGWKVSEFLLADGRNEQGSAGAGETIRRGECRGQGEGE